MFCDCLFLILGFGFRFDCFALLATLLTLCLICLCSLLRVVVQFVVFLFDILIVCYLVIYVLSCCVYRLGLWFRWRFVCLDGCFVFSCLGF